MLRTARSCPPPTSGSPPLRHDRALDLVPDLDPDLDLEPGSDLDPDLDPGPGPDPDPDPDLSPGPGPTPAPAPAQRGAPRSTTGPSNAPSFEKVRALCTPSAWTRAR
ncbi:hypothetical protein GCM10018779_01380 [Streptomyces griseocarneus]|nr:hypothetical protein GCM10018779_01380 [Streptomyces griseocarneus]